MSNSKMQSAVHVAGSEASPLSITERFELSCGANGCAANCCKNGPPIVLNPYEIAMICREGGLSYDDLLDIVETERMDGFPLVMLPRDPACHFWSDGGCDVYRARPLACRLFPLGRVFHEGRSSIVLPERNICTGIVKDPARTVGDYLQDQDVEKMIEMADKWIEFVSEMEKLGLPDRPVTSIAFHMMVYSPDIRPPAQGALINHNTPEESFLLRLSIARADLPRFLNLQ